MDAFEVFYHTLLDSAGEDPKEDDFTDRINNFLSNSFSIAFSSIPFCYYFKGSIMPKLLWSRP